MKLRCGGAFLACALAVLNGAAVAGAAPRPAHAARVGPLALLALGELNAGRSLPASRAVGRWTPNGPAYGTLIRGQVSSAELTALGAVPGTILPGAATADATLPQLQAIAALPGVTEVDLAGRATRRLDQSVPQTHAAEPNHAADPAVPHLWSGSASTGFSGTTGKGVVVGSVDSGIDLQHQDFRRADGTTRVRWLWDQAAGGGAPPSGYNYGAQCSAQQVDLTNNGGTGAACGPFTYLAAAAGGDCATPAGGQAQQVLPEQDCDGHGTHTIGIAASNGRAGTQPGTYIGMAPEADIVAVKTDNDLAHIIDGVAYIFGRADALGEPAAVNLSLGPNNGPHDGTSIFETMIDQLSGPAHPGHIITVAAGNQATAGLGGRALYYHASGQVGLGQSVTERLVIGATPVHLDLWYRANDSFSISVNGPGVAVGPVPAPPPSSRSAPGVGPDGSCGQGPGVAPSGIGSDPATGNSVAVLSCTAMPGSGDNEIQVYISNPGNRSGGYGLKDCSPSACIDTWTVTLHGDAVVSGGFQAWTFDQGDYFFHGGDGNDNTTVGSPATGHQVISVGSYVSRTNWPSQAGAEADPAGRDGEISYFSAVGPTRDQRPGIDLVAPGEFVGSSLSAHASTGLQQSCGVVGPGGSPIGGACLAPDGAHVFLQGTSMASPHVAGAIALLLQQSPAMTVDQVRRVLGDSALADVATGPVPNPRAGAGKLQLGPGVVSLSPARAPLNATPSVTACGADFKAGMTVNFQPVSGGAFQALTVSPAGQGCVAFSLPASATPGLATLRFSDPDGAVGVDHFMYDPVPNQLRPVVPFRVLDTRADGPRQGSCTNSCLPLGTGQSTDVQVTGITGSGVPASGVAAVVLNVTAVRPSAAGFLTIWPSGAPRPTASNLNFTAGQTVANLVEVPVSNGGTVSIYNLAGTTDVLFDVSGFVPTSAGGSDGLFNPVVPARILDTRPDGPRTGSCSGGCATLRGGQSLDLQVVAAGGVPGTGAEAVVLNVTATNPSAPGFVTVYPTGDPRPLASNLNFVAGQTVPNRVIVDVGSAGRVTLYNFQGNTDLVVDVNGWLTDGVAATTGSVYSPLQPARVLDTRATSALVGGATRVLQVAGTGGVPGMDAAAPPRAVVLNVTAVGPSSPGYLTVYPTGSSRPVASDLNWVAGETVPNLVVVQVGPQGQVNLYNFQGITDVVVDVEGWYS